MNIVKESLWEKLKKAQKPIYLYGTGNGADKILDILSEKDIEVSGIFASDGFVRSRVFRGFEVCSYSAAKEKNPEMVVLMAFGSEREDVRENVLKIKSEQEFYCPDVPLYGEGIFDVSYFEKNRENGEKIYSLLADEKSKEVYENIINAKISGDVSYLIFAETAKEDEYKILNLSDNEIFMDLGAYRGDTVEEFLSFAPSYEKIYAVEPDTKTYKKLLENTKERNIECINAAICDKDEILFIQNNKGRGTSVSETGTQFPGRSVDSILGGEKVTFIKMDVEGSEALAIDGAKESIKNYKPKLKIAAYHRNEDLFSLPLKILSIRDDYKMYIRHRPSFPAWDVDFIFV